MARARNIKPAFFQNDALGEIDPLGRLLFIGLWTIADYKGCVEYRPKRIKAQLLPYDTCDVEALVTCLDKSGFITIYSVAGNLYLKIANFERHQNPHPNERKTGSDIPDIPENYSENNDLQEIAKNHEQDGTDRADSLIPLTDSPILIPDSGILIPESLPAKIAKPSVDRRKAPTDRDADPVPGIFAYWQERMQSPSSKLDAKRIAKIRAALKIGYTPRQLCEAIKGCSLTPHNMGVNDRNRKYNSIELIFRDADHIDGFIQAAKNPPKAGGEETIEQRNARITAEVLGTAEPEGGDIIEMEPADEQ